MWERCLACGSSPENRSGRSYNDLSKGELPALPTRASTKAGNVGHTHPHTCGTDGQGACRFPRRFRSDASGLPRRPAGVGGPNGNVRACCAANLADLYHRPEARRDRKVGFGGVFPWALRGQCVYCDLRLLPHAPGYSEWRGAQGWGGAVLQEAGAPYPAPILPRDGLLASADLVADRPENGYALGLQPSRHLEGGRGAPPSRSGYLWRATNQSCLLVHCGRVADLFRVSPPGPALEAL